MPLSVLFSGIEDNTFSFSGVVTNLNNNEANKTNFAKVPTFLILAKKQ